jgi:hypothetical protein
MTHWLNTSGFCTSVVSSNPTCANLLHIIIFLKVVRGCSFLTRSIVLPCSFPKKKIRQKTFTNRCVCLDYSSTQDEIESKEKSLHQHHVNCFVISFVCVLLCCDFFLKLHFPNHIYIEKDKYGDPI